MDLRPAPDAPPAARMASNSPPLASSDLTGGDGADVSIMVSSVAGGGGGGGDGPCKFILKN